MTTKQKNEVKKLIKSDCEIRREYYQDGATCAIGKLALAVNVLPKTLQEYGTTSIDRIPYLISKISKRFGISGKHLEQIQLLNDDCPSRNQRRKMILKYLDTIATK